MISTLSCSNETHTSQSARCVGHPAGYTFGGYVHHAREKMENKILFFVGVLLCATSASPQEQPRELRGGGHLLGESAEQFFSEGFVGDVLRACQAKDWKTVSSKVGHVSKSLAKDYCANEELARQQATAGTRLQHNGRGDEETMRTDTFTFEGGHLVKINMVYLASTANIEGYHPKYFPELFAGLQEAYGPPSKSSSETVQNAYGVKFEAHRALWLSNQNVIRIIEQPGSEGRTEIIAETAAEYNREAQAPKVENPLQ
jgi:hypothetical protein